MATRNGFALFIALGLFCASASAQVFQLTFEGLQSTEAVENFYNGGTGSLGSAGANNGVSFSAAAIAAIDSDAGGTGNFANEPSPNTIITFLSGPSLVMNVPAGFNTGFSFYYSSTAAAAVTVYDGLNATGNVLGTINLVAQFSGNGCVGDPTGTFCNWSQAGVNFSGTARSVDFAGAANQVGFDNITFGTSTPALPSQPIPALSGWGLILLSLAVGALGFIYQRRRNAL